MPLQKKLLNFSKMPASFLSLRVAGLLFAAELAIATLYYWQAEGYSILDAFYMVVITISTVGFTEVQTLSDHGRLFTSLLILINIAVIAYILAVFSYYIVEGEIFKRMHINQIAQRINQLEGHVIVCGFGKYGKEITANLTAHGIGFVVVDNNTDLIMQIQHTNPNMLYLVGDATQDDTLLEAGVQRAHGLISALNEDSSNLFVVLSARQLNPHLKIISRAIEPGAEAKLLKVGANHVVMPETIGGFYMATLFSKPGAVEFFSFMTREYHSDMGFEELTYDNLPSAYRGRPISDLALRSQTGANIIGHRSASGAYTINPGPEVVLEEGASFIVLGDDVQLAKLRQLCKYTL